MKPPKSIRPQNAETISPLEVELPETFFNIDVNSYLKIDVNGTLKIHTHDKSRMNNTIVLGYARPKPVQLTFTIGKPSRWQKFKNWIKNITK